MLEVRENSIKGDTKVIQFINSVSMMLVGGLSDLTEQEKIILTDKQRLFYEKGILEGSFRYNALGEPIIFTPFSEEEYLEKAKENISQLADKINKGNLL